MRWVPPWIWSALSGLWIRLAVLYTRYWIASRQSWFWEASVAGRVQRSPKPSWFSTEQVNLMSLKMTREEWLFAPDIARTFYNRLDRPKTDYVLPSKSYRDNESRGSTQTNPTSNALVNWNPHPPGPGTGRGIWQRPWSNHTKTNLSYTAKHTHTHAKNK